MTAQNIDYQKHTRGEKRKKKTLFVKSCFLLAPVLLFLLLLLGRTWKAKKVAYVEHTSSQHKLSTNEISKVYAPMPTKEVVEFFHANGVLKSRSEHKKGRLNGLSQGWYPNGQLQVEEYFKEGVSHGLKVNWYADGVKKSEAHISEGQLNGIYKRWHQNGILAAEVIYNKGVPHGKSRAFYPSGYLKAEIELEAGEVFKETRWKDGEVKL